MCLALRVKNPKWFRLGESKSVAVSKRGNGFGLAIEKAQVVSAWPGQAPKWFRPGQSRKGFLHGLGKIEGDFGMA